MKWTRARRIWISSAATLALASAACLQSHVKTTIDLRSFLSPEVVEKSYTLPPDVPVIELRTDPARLEISGKLRNIGELEEAGASFEATFSNQSGRGRADVALYASNSAETLYQSEPLLDLALDLLPGDERTLGRHLDAEPRLLELLRDGKLYLGFQYGWSSAGGDTVSGSYRITKLEVQVTSRISNILASAQSELARPGPN